MDTKTELIVVFVDHRMLYIVVYYNLATVFCIE